MKNLIFAITFILSILLIINAQAYSNSDLVAYFSLGDGNGTSIYDTHNSIEYINANAGNLIEYDGIVGLALYSDRGLQFNTEITEIYDSDFSFNYWAYYGDGATVYDPLAIILAYTEANEASFYVNTASNTINSFDVSYYYLVATSSINISETITGWSMLTWTYTKSTSTLKAYVNGIYKGSASLGNQLSLEPLVIYFYQSNINDELSIWKNDLSEADVAALYNSGFGLSYLQTINQTIINQTPICLDSSTYCSNPVYIGSKVHCAYGNTTYCSGGCSNGICTVTIESECNVMGAKKCYDSTQIATCDDSNSDGALDYGSITSCESGQLCFESFNYATCINVSSFENVHNEYSFSSVPSTIVNDGSNDTVLTIDTLNKVLTAKTINPFVAIDFIQSGITYIARDCDYKEVIQYENKTTTEINETITYTLNSALTDSQIIVDVSLELGTLSNGSILIKSEEGTVLSQLLYMRNSSNKQVKISLTNGSIVYDNYDAETVDSFSSLDLRYYFDTVNDYYTIKFTFNQKNDNVKIWGVINLNNDNVYTITLNGNNTIKNIKVVTATLPSQWSTLTGANTYCAYTSSGTYKVRTYGNTFVSPDYQSYKDYTIVVNGLNLESVEQPDTNNLFSGYSENTKYWIMLGVSLGVLLLFTIILAIFGDALAGLLVGLVISMITSLTLTLIFKLSLLVPILYIIIGGAVFAFLMRKVFAG